jgi:hypothetical protein
VAREEKEMSEWNGKTWEELPDHIKERLRGDIPEPTAAVEHYQRKLYWRGYGNGWIEGRTSVAFKKRALFESAGFLWGFTMGALIMSVILFLIFIRKLC